MDIDDITAPPGKISSELKSLQGGEKVVIKEAAQPGRVMTTNFKGIPQLMTCIAMSLSLDNSRYHLVAKAWILRHFSIS